MTSPRNKTITVNAADQKSLPILKFKATDNIDNLKNKIYFGNALEEMKRLPSNFVDLIVTDPPYTIKKNFGQGTISTNEKEFTLWCEQWIKECSRLLKSSGSIYICINWEATSIIESILKKYFKIQNRITWKRDKGRGAKRNWKNNLEDIWFATKSNDYTFNLDQVKIKKPVIAPYVDKDGQPKDWQEVDGKKFRFTHPSNIWTDLVVPFWSMPENTEHPTQKPEKLIERIILASSNMDDLIFDPFMGSGTTAVVAEKLNRNFLGFEIEKKYYLLSQKRLLSQNKKAEF
ncbi:MAG: DNA methyltransferase [Patescibacteria group bacterium]